jgi:hypothetical protein
MPNSDITLYRALVIRSLDQEVHVKIPSILGANETITIHRPTTVGASWPPDEGDQLIVAIEGENFNKVYLINNITNTANINNATINSINGGSA